MVNYTSIKYYLKHIFRLYLPVKMKIMIFLYACAATFSFLGYDTYNEYVEAGNDEAAYMLADNANMIVSGEFTDDGNVIESTVRGIKLGDSIDKVIELYGDTKQRSADIKDVFSHDGLKDSGAYNYFLKIDSTKDYFYAFRFRVDQNNNIIAVVIEPISMKYWSED